MKKVLLKQLFPSVSVELIFNDLFHFLRLLSYITNIILSVAIPEQIPQHSRRKVWQLDLYFSGVSLWRARTRSSFSWTNQYH